MKELLYNGLMTTQGALTLGDVIINFLAACVISILIYISYRLSHTGAVYSRKFNVSLIMLVLVTTLVMNVIGNNIALSLGMVGALSIVRFRTAIKDPRDAAYIFWAIAVGICCGVSDYLIAGIGTFIIFLFLALFGMVRDNERIMIVVRMESKAVEAVDECVGKAVDALLSVDGTMFICADHGNAEQLVDYETGEPFTAHTTNEVPFILVNYDPAYSLAEGGCLADIVPTLIATMGKEQPAEMTGKSLLIKK